MSFAFANMTEKLIPISDFSQGKAGKIFNDVAQNNSEYIVLKNNQPTAVLISLSKNIRTPRKSWPALKNLWRPLRIYVC